MLAVFGRIPEVRKPVQQEVIGQVFPLFFLLEYLKIIQNGHGLALLIHFRGIPKTYRNGAVLKLSVVLVFNLVGSAAVDKGVVFEPYRIWTIVQIDLFQGSLGVMELKE